MVDERDDKWQVCEDKSIERRNNNPDNAWTIGINWTGKDDLHYNKIEVYDWDKERGIDIATRVAAFLNEQEIEGGK